MSTIVDRAFRGGLALSLVLGISACNARPARPEEVSLQVAGMHCEDCAVGITTALRQRRGILGTDVHFSNQVQVVRFDANRISTDHIVSLVKDRGFDVRVATPSTSSSTQEKQNP